MSLISYRYKDKLFPSSVSLDAKLELAVSLLLVAFDKAWDKNDSGIYNLTPEREENKHIHQNAHLSLCQLFKFVCSELKQYTSNVVLKGIFKVHPTDFMLYLKHLQTLNDQLKNKKQKQCSRTKHLFFTHFSLPVLTLALNYQ